MSKKNSKRSSAVISRLKGLVSIIETFNRTDGVLGNAAGTTSVPWSSVRGSWLLSSNKAISASAGSDYPISTLSFTKEDVTLSADGIGPGVGTAFWVTDANNWWGTYQDSNYTCQTCYNTSNVASYVTNSTYVPASGGNCASSSSPCGSYNAGNPAPGYYCYFTNIDPSWFGWGCGGLQPGAWNTVSCGQCGGCPGTCCRRCEQNYNAGNCASYYQSCNAYNTYYPAFTFNTSNISTYNASTPYSCNCTTSYSIKLIKNVAGTISTVTSFAISAAIVGMKTVLSGNSVTVKAYSASGYTSQIGADQSFTISGQTKTKKHGILKAPNTYTPTQTSIIDEFRGE
jgi:hypothetical protein